MVYANNKIASWMLLAVVVSIAAIIVAVPLLPAWTSYTTCIFSEATFFQIAVEVMLAAWIPLALATPRFRPRRSWLTGAVVFYAVVMMASLFFAVDPSLSAWSKVTRMTGVINMLHIVGWFLVLSSSLRGIRQWRFLLTASVVVSTLISIIAIIEGVAGSGPVVATMCNQSFLAAYLLPHVGIAMFLLFREKQWFFRVALLTTSTILHLIAMYFSASRSGMLASLILVASFLVVLVARTKFKAHNRRFLVALIIIAFCAVIGAVIGLRYLSAVGKLDANLPRPVSRLVLKDFGDDRLVLWTYAWRGFMERPIFGWGNEQFSTLYSQHYNPAGLDKYVFNERWQDRAHNQYLDSLVSYGIFGFLAFVLIWALAIKRVRSLYRDDVLDVYQSSMLMSVFVALMLFYAFNFDTPAALIVIYMLFAFCVGVSPPRRDDRLFHSAMLGAALITISFAVVGIRFINVVPAMSMKTFSEAESTILTDGMKSFEKYSVALKGVGPYRNDFRLNHLFAIQKYVDHAGMRGMPLETLVRQAVHETKDMVGDAPYDYRSHLANAVANRLMAEFGEDTIQTAKVSAQKALELAPTRFDAHFELGEISLAARNYRQSEHHFMRAIEYSYWNLAGFDELVYYRLAQLYVEQGDYAMAREWLARSQAGAAYPATQDARLVMAMDNLLETDQAASAFAFTSYVDATLNNFIVHPELHAAAARYYAALGNKNRAAQIVNGMVATTPALARQLVEELDLPFTE